MWRTGRLLREAGDPNRPPPTLTFKDRHVLEFGPDRLELAFHGPNHSPDNIFIYAPRHRTLMVVDVLFPGWVPFKSLAVSQDIPGWVRAHDIAMDYRLDHPRWRPRRSPRRSCRRRAAARVHPRSGRKREADDERTSTRLRSSSSTARRATPGRSSRPTSTPPRSRPPRPSSTSTSASWRRRRLHGRQCLRAVRVTAPRRRYPGPVRDPTVNGCPDEGRFAPVTGSHEAGARSRAGSTGLRSSGSSAPETRPPLSAPRT